MIFLATPNKPYSYMVAFINFVKYSAIQVNSNFGVNVPCHYENEVNNPVSHTVIWWPLAYVYH